MADAEKVLHDLLNKILDDRDYRARETKVEAITTGGANYTSVLFNVHILLSSGDDLRLFAKVRCTQGLAWKDTMKIDILYDTERFVYTKLVQIYEDIQDENDVPDEHRFVFPKFYGYNAESQADTVVMEDLTAVGFESFNRFKPLNWDYATAAVENLAKFHALSFAFEKYRPDEFEIVTSGMKYLIDTVDNPDKVESVIAAYKETVVNLSILNDEQKERVKHFIMTHNLRDKYYKPIGKPVIAHGDYRLSNLMFRKQEGVLESIAVDYQTVHAGCPVSDLLYFIFMGSDEEFRRQYYEKLLDYYYSSLEQALERLSVDTSVYSREKFDSDMEKLLPYAVLIGVMILPVVTVEADSAPKRDGDADVRDYVTKPNELYAKRFSGIVNDCIRWGAI